MEKPEDAYLETISKFTEKDLPAPDDLPMPIGIELKISKKVLIKILIMLLIFLNKKAVDKFQNRWKHRRV